MCTHNIHTHTNSRTKLGWFDVPPHASKSTLVVKKDFCSACISSLALDQAELKEISRNLVSHFDKIGGLKE